MKDLSKIALAVQPSATLAIDTMFKQMRADGLDVIGFGAGEPDFSTPDHIKEAGIQAIQNNDTKYTPSAGTVELRKAVCQRLKEDCGVDYEPSQISVSSGAKPCVYTALRALVDPGDEVILPAPYWVSYIELIRMVGGVPVVVEASEAEHFKITPEKLAAAITPKTKCMILNNPSNPTGMMYSRSELEAIAKVCVENDLYVISDEIYYQVVYDNEEHILPQGQGEGHLQVLCHDRLAHRLCGRPRKHLQADRQLSEPLYQLPLLHLPEGRGGRPVRLPRDCGGHAEGVRGAPQLHGGPHESDRGGQLYPASRRLLCDDEH